MRHTNSCIIIATAAVAAALVTPPSRTHGRITRTPRTTARVAPAPRTRLAAAPAKTSVVRYARSYDFQSGDVPVGAAARRAVEFFAAWNKRDMEAACACFSDDCVYEDTQYSGAFEGKAKLREHLDRVADALPDTFAFVVDDIADGGDTVGVRWCESVSFDIDGVEVDARSPRAVDAGMSRTTVSRCPSREARRSTKRTGTASCARVSTCRNRRRSNRGGVV